MSRSTFQRSLNRLETPDLWMMFPKSQRKPLTGKTQLLSLWAFCSSGIRRLGPTQDVWRQSDTPTICGEAEQVYSPSGRPPFDTRLTTRGLWGWQAGPHAAAVSHRETDSGGYFYPKAPPSSTKCSSVQLCLNASFAFSNYRKNREKMSFGKESYYKSCKH